MHLILSMMYSNINEVDNGVNETGIISDEGFSPGRVTCVGEQAVLGRQPTTVHDKIVKRKWSKADYHYYYYYNYYYYYYYIIIIVVVIIIIVEHW